MEATVFKPMQVQLLRMLSYVRSDSQMHEIKKVLSDYFFNKVEEGMDALWESGEWSEEKNEAIMKEHLRTPYIHK